LPAIQAAYPGLTLGVEVGLVPLGPDPDSGLWEFADLASGVPPARGGDGRLLVGADSGLVFVLLPEGEFWMGAQNTDPKGANYDPLSPGAENPYRETPVHKAVVEPFFLSKYELSQGQWQRLAGTNPSNYSTPPFANLLHPVEQVSWLQCTELLARFGLRLPLEREWEYAARGGSNTPWWTGSERASLRGAVNIADQAAARAGANWVDIQDWPDFDDGCPVHTAVNSLRPNAFGLHHVLGNVWEWCQDVFSEGHGEKVERFPASQVIRGGAFRYTVRDARVSARNDILPTAISQSLGLRPARSLASSGS
jgi:formylglycine-generating enzyme required for sulfatase activity